ncbi:MAG: hypothetical protein ACE15B_22875 [Bryobacteraceae bacterium]
MTRRDFLSAVLGGVTGRPDPRTGREVWQITSGGAVSHSCYFEAQPFTAGDRYLVYSSNRTGAWQLYRVDLRTGETAQLTRAARLANLSFSMHPDGRNVVYQDGDRLAQTDVPTGRETVLIDLARALGGSRFSAGRTFSRDGRFTAASYVDKAGAPGIALVDLRAGAIAKTAPVENGTGGHLLICPADPCLVTYVRTPDEQNNMKLPMERRARTMIADFRTGKSRPFLIMPYGFRATHEYWAPDGERFYFHGKTQPGWVPATICSMRRDGSDRRTHFTSNYMLGHSMITHDSRYIVSDVQKPNDNPLILIDLKTGDHRILCWPDSSVAGGHPKSAHVHPSFSRTGKYIAYTSDRTGTGQVYVVQARF